MYKCQQLPFFCDDQFLPKYIWDPVVDANGIARPTIYQETKVKAENFKYEDLYQIDPAWQDELDGLSNPSEEDKYYKKVPGCCSCERYILPYYFLDTSRIDLGDLDNKHTYVQLSILAVEDSELTVVIELLNGQYYRDFELSMPDSSDISIHRPSRAINNPSVPSRMTFMMLLDQNDLESQDIALPLNLPMQQRRNPGVEVISIGTPGSTSFSFENSILIGRISNIYQGDPLYEDRYAIHMRDVYIAAQAANKTTDDFPPLQTYPIWKRLVQHCTRSPTLSVTWNINLFGGPSRKLVVWDS